jgi:hypothetical protein
MTDVTQPSIKETCRCGASIELTGPVANDRRLGAWRTTHRCLSADEERFKDLPQRTGAGDP